MKMLHIKLDLCGWISKAKQWIPGDKPVSEEGYSKQGKLEDLRDHVTKAATFRDRLTLTPENKRIGSSKVSRKKITRRSCGRLAGTSSFFLDTDNRKKDSLDSISIPELRQIVQDRKAIHINMGTPMSKIGRILAQADRWYEEYHPLLLRCDVEEGTRKSEWCEKPQKIQQTRDRRTVKTQSLPSAQSW
jgi:hypothetical protein